MCGAVDHILSSEWDELASVSFVMAGLSIRLWWKSVGNLLEALSKIVLKRGCASLTSRLGDPDEIGEKSFGFGEVP